jgi:hypothetical protein
MRRSVRFRSSALLLTARPPTRCGKSKGEMDQYSGEGEIDFQADMQREFPYKSGIPGKLHKLFNRPHLPPVLAWDSGHPTEQRGGRPRTGTQRSDGCDCRGALFAPLLIACARTSYAGGGWSGRRQRN